MDGKRLVAIVASFAATFLPIYLLERIANYYYLIDQPSTFFFVSGLRLILFIVFAATGSFVSGLLLRDLKWAAVTQLFAVVALFAGFYIFCSSPRVCYSVGPDGLEPFRFGFILAMTCLFGASAGVALRPHTPPSRWSTVLGTLSSFAFILYFPTVYTFGGGRFFPLFYPWIPVFLLALLACLTSAKLIEALGSPWGILLPLLVIAGVFSLAAPLSLAYVAQVELPASLLALSIIVGTLLGFAVARPMRAFRPKWFLRCLPILVFIVLVIGSFWVIPDEVTGLVPVTGGSGTPAFAMGVPVYAGGFMASGAAPAYGIASTVSFAGTNSSAIQANNYLSAGIGAHSPDCCVDGIDYGYRFDLYLFHDGNESLLASAWQACDDNAACGGHSWKVLMFSKGAAPEESSGSQPVYLQIEWEGHSAIWSYRVGQGSMIEFASFTAPTKENPAFNVGTLDVSSAFSTQQSANFYQFGITSLYPLGHGGWLVKFSCPSTLQNHTWGCITKAESEQGVYSFWKILWRWGEDYPNVVVSSRGSDYFALSYSPTSTMGNLSPLFS